jgi:transposase-like protein
MSRGRRLTETDRLSIAKERAQGVAAADLAQRYGVSLKTIYNAVNHALDRQNANGSRPIVIGLRVSRRELAAFDAALARHGITNRTDALRHLVLAVDEILEPDHALTEALSARAADISRIGNNINQVARRLNEARLKGQPLSYTAESHGHIREFAGLILDLTDRLQALLLKRRADLALKVTKAWAPLIPDRLRRG